MKEKHECTLSLMAQTTLVFEAEESELDDVLEKQRDALIAKLSALGFTVDVLSEELE